MPHSDSYRSRRSYHRSLAVRDLTCLWQLLCDKEILLVLHAAAQDLDLIHKISGLIPCNVFDTQIAAGFAGFGYPVGYGKLLSQLLGITIAKSESFTDWLSRPLTAPQVEYAREDVLHLLPIYDCLCEKLENMGRLDWAREECRRFVDRARYHKNKGLDYLKIKGASSLNRRGLAVLQALCDWRNGEARRVDKPAKMVLSENILIELARHPPTEIVTLSAFAG